MDLEGKYCLMAITLSAAGEMICKMDLVDTSNFKPLKKIKITNLKVYGEMVTISRNKRSFMISDFKLLLSLFSNKLVKVKPII